MDGVKQSYFSSGKLPLVIEPAHRGIEFDEFLGWLKSNEAELRKQILDCGGILLRGFPLKTAEHFSAAIDTLGLGKALDYIGGDSPRDKVTGSVYTSTEAPPSIKIPLHNELSFVNKYPRHIYFFCEKAPVEKGETIIADARQILRDIDPAVRARFEQRHLLYSSCYFYKSKVMDLINKMQRSHKSWIDVFETEDSREVEAKCRANDFFYRWTKNDWIQIAQKRPPVINHPETGEPVWFNQVHLYDFNPRLLGMWRYIGAKLFYARKHTRLHEVFFADGKRIPRKDIYHIMDVLDKNTIAFPWQSGDMLILDNVLAMHGRNTFTGKRRVLTALTGAAASAPQKVELNAELMH